MRLWLLALVASLAGCSSAPTCAMPPAPRADAQPFLWRAQGTTGATVWLYGTIHNGGTGDIANAAWTALDGSSHFVSELGDSEPDREKAIAYARIETGAGIDQQLPPDDWYDLRDALDGVIKEDVLRRARPWFAMTQLMMRISPSPKPTMDFALARHARDKQIAVDNLETWEEQLAALDGAVKVSDLQQAIHARRTMGCELASMLATYKTGDLPAMQKLLLVEGSSLLKPRNEKWLPKIVTYFDAGGAFVAVGLGHLAGGDGLPAMLARAGYTVERVTK